MDGYKLQHCCNKSTGMKKQSLFIFLFLLTTGWLSAQHQITGQIFLSDDQVPAIGASVYLPELERGTVTGPQGSFVLDDIPKGTYDLQVSYVGYLTHLETVTLNAERPIWTIALTLQPQAHELEGIVVSGGYLTTQDENAIKIDKLEPADLQSTTHFLEALARIPGVDQINRGPGIGKPVIRGLRNSQVLVLNNGVRNENYQYSDSHPIGLDEWGVERIEVIKGPASLLYGSGALGGVINLIKERPASPGQIVGDVLTQYHSNTDGWSGTAGVRAGSEQFFGGARVGLKSHQDYQDGNGERIANTRFNTMALRTHAGYRSKKWVSKLYYDLDRQQMGMFNPYARQHVTENGRDLDIWYQNLNNQLVKWQNTFILSKLQLKVHTGWQENHRRLQNPQTSPEQPDLGAPIDMRMRTLTYDVQAAYRHNASLRLIGGIQGMLSRNTNEEAAPGRILPNGDMRDIGLYGLLQYEWSEALNTQVGARYDWRRVDTELTQAGLPSEKPAVLEDFGNGSLSVGTTWDLSDTWLLRSNVATAFRAPNFIELTANGLHGSRWERGNTDLSPERSFEADLSGHYHDDWLTLEGAVFYNRIQDYIFLSPTAADAPAGGGPIFAYMQEDARLYGLEAGFHLHPAPIPWLHLASSYNLVRGEQDNGDQLPLIPAQVWNNEIGVHGDLSRTIQQGFARLTVDRAFAQNQTAPFEAPTDGYTLIGFRMGATVYWQSQPLEWQVSVTNLLDEVYFHHLSTLRPLQVANPGRNIVTTLRIPLGR